MELLLSHGADVYALDDEGQTPLHHAHDADMAAVLLANGAAVAARDLQGRTPLFCTDNPGVVRVLLEHGADPNAKDDDGGMPLHKFAAMRNRSDAIELLLRYSAAVNAVHASDQETPLDVAARYGNRAAAELLLSHGASLDIHVAAGLGLCEAVKEFLEENRALIMTWKFGRTPLHWAARSGQLDVVRMLVGFGADVEVRTHTLGQTPLHEAVARGQEQVVEFLLASGSNANSPDKLHRTALDIVDTYRWLRWKSPGLLPLLIKYGAKSGKN